MPQITPEDLEKLKRAGGTPGVEEVILRRWSPRAFSDREVSRETISRLFDAARWAASSFNEQPWRFLVGRRGDETYKKIFDSLMEFNQSWAKSAPLLVLSIGKKTFTHDGKTNRHALHDTGAAMANLALQATAEGLHTHSMAGFNPDLARASFGIPQDYEMGAVTAIGYLGDANALSDNLRAREISPRERKPLSKILFSEWEKPLTL